jgi:hypothetical protein
MWAAVCEEFGEHSLGPSWFRCAQPWHDSAHGCSVYGSRGCTRGVMGLTRMCESSQRHAGPAWHPAVLEGTGPVVIGPEIARSKGETACWR